MPIYILIERSVKNGRIDFWNEDAIRTLGKAILDRDYSLRVEFPENRLCPMVPNRATYIRYIHDLLSSTSGQKDKKRIIGLDIGTGASCIYPLLGCRMYSYDFVGTEIDKFSFETAKSNILQNNMESQIKIVLRSKQDCLLPDTEGMEEFTFVMCNPPFYEHEEDFINFKQNPPSGVCTGVYHEMVTEGGEVGFANKILTESKKRKGIQWYTCMFGKKSSVPAVVDKLREQNISNYGIYELALGKTKRWIICWSFQAMRPHNELIRPSSTSLSKYFPHKVLQNWTLDPELCAQIDDILQKFLDDNKIPWSKKGSVLEISTKSITWSRKARRISKSQTSVSSLEGQMKCELNVIDNQLQCKWIEGYDYNVYESFCSALARALRDNKK
ncbi:23S rRNA/U6 snRNA (adenine-N(6))-methyltransferase Mtl16 [Schizosaccharomyces pombe]|uniref:U6 small nuclear RNA (adenine-(43)-N(6))-methyltransferase n=2 Tax=Schizosaccharomyces pombe TaxID=4896 RepID=MTL16_SCHPO|nr:uncharacterized protein SPAC27D7.08c [Schizosaccharomyces pombe]O42662.2 RecName: Full=U6 small nuclear RNA (adenine-(43)-N(6))-methyltransferase [Schizosaccharomyces pombe 972h-]CAA15827.2 DUF890 family protein [Schizosaccharomyces pombe]|eukprot:NP_594614.1 uncharacterized protein SPAC27D7.08c [Schizosaccharomyces pombe]